MTIRNLIHVENLNTAACSQDGTLREWRLSSLRCILVQQRPGVVGILPVSRWFGYSAWEARPIDREAPEDGAGSRFYPIPTLRLTVDRAYSARPLLGKALHWRGAGIAQ